MIEERRSVNVQAKNDSLPKRPEEYSIGSFQAAKKMQKDEVGLHTIAFMERKTGTKTFTIE